MAASSRIEMVLLPLLRRVPSPWLRPAIAALAVAFALDLVVFDPLPLLDEAGLGLLLWHALRVLNEDRARPTFASPDPRRAEGASPGREGPSRPAFGGRVDVTGQGVAGPRGEEVRPASGDAAGATPTGGNPPLVHEPIDRRVWKVDATIRGVRAELRRQVGLPEVVGARLGRLQAAAADEIKRLKRLEAMLDRTAFDPWSAHRDLERAAEAASRPASPAARARLDAVLQAARSRRDQVGALLECRDLAAARLMELHHRVMDLQVRLTLLDLDDPERIAAAHADLDAELASLERVPEELAEARREVSEALERRASAPGSSSSSRALVRLLRN
ncbi:hypothetical protein L6R50_08745 [Myxococcota bacterium]|nr:hypothetical protein [Myxococcota bacterium]